MEIWEELGSDRERGAKRLVAEYGNRLLTAATYLTQNEADAEDLVFRTFSHVVGKIGTYDGRSAFFSWLYAIMLNFRRMDLRRKAANALVFTDEIPDGQDPRPDPAEALVLESTAADVRKGIAALPEALRVPIVMHYYDDFGVAEIANMMELPVGTVKFRLYEARKRLARWLVQTEFTQRASNTQENGKKRYVL